MKRYFSILLFLFSFVCFYAQAPTSEADSKMNEALNYIEKKNYPAALTTMNDVINIRKGSKEYYLRAFVHYYITNYRAAIEDCNRALDYNNSIENNNIIHHLRGLCYYEMYDIQSAVSDMKQAGELGTNFLREKNLLRNKSTNNSQRARNNGVQTSSTNRIPQLKKTK